MTDARESVAEGEFELTEAVEGWARSDDPARPRGAARTVEPGTYPVVSQLHEGEDENFYCLDVGSEDVFVPALQGTYHARASGG